MTDTDTDCRGDRPTVALSRSSDALIAVEGSSKSEADDRARDHLADEPTPSEAPRRQRWEPV